MSRNFINFSKLIAGTSKNFLLIFVFLLFKLKCANLHLKKLHLHLPVTSSKHKSFLFVSNFFTVFFFVAKVCECAFFTQMAVASQETNRFDSRDSSYHLCTKIKKKRFVIVVVQWAVNRICDHFLKKSTKSALITIDLFKKTILIKMHKIFYLFAVIALNSAEEFRTVSFCLVSDLLWQNDSLFLKRKFVFIWIHIVYMGQGHTILSMSHMSFALMIWKGKWNYVIDCLEKSGPDHVFEAWFKLCLCFRCSNLLKFKWLHCAFILAYYHIVRPYTSNYTNQ